MVGSEGKILEDLDAINRRLDNHDAIITGLADLGTTSRLRTGDQGKKVQPKMGRK